MVKRKKRKRKNKSQSPPLQVPKNSPKSTASSKKPEKANSLIQDTKAPILGNDLKQLSKIEDNPEKLSVQEKENIALIQKLLNQVKEFYTQIESNRNKESQARQDADKLKDDLENELKNLAEKEDALNAKEREVNAREQDILKRETDAQAGFIEIEKKFLKSLEKTKDSLLKKCENFQNIIIGQEGDWQLKKQAALTNKIVELQEELDKRESSLAKREVEVQLQEAILKQQASGIAEVIENRKKQMEQEWKGLLDDQINRNKSLQDKIKQLEKQISSFEEIRSQLDGRSPDETNILIAELKGKNNELRIKLEQSGGSELQDRYEQIQEDLRDKEDMIYDLSRQLREKKERLASLEYGNTNKLLIKRRNEQLQTNTELLDEGLKQLQNELKDLKQRTKNMPVFSELIKLDEKYKKTKRVLGRDNNSSLKDFVNALRNNMGVEGFDYSEEILQLFVGGLSMSRLIILQGISGTGKTSLAHLFAKVVSGEVQEDQEAFHKIAVQAGWRDNQDLLGYYNAFERKYYEKEFTIGLYKANTPRFRDLPFITLLDEMNLSHVEQYFADLLTELEDQDKKKYLRLRLASGVDKSDNSPRYLDEDGQHIIIPKNVWFIGTANKDETTMEFADKTYDRSHIMVLKRRPHQGISFKPEDGHNSCWSYSDLVEAFNEAKSRYEKDPATVLHEMESSLAGILDKEFEVGWGNRLERQLNDFVPVVVASGGTVGLALDHILATKILRNGKVTGRFDITKNPLEELKDKVEELLKCFKVSPDNSNALKLLQDDINRKN